MNPLIHKWLHAIYMYIVCKDHLLDNFAPPPKQWVIGQFFFVALSVEFFYNPPVTSGVWRDTITGPCLIIWNKESLTRQTHLFKGLPPSGGDCFRSPGFRPSPAAEAPLSRLASSFSCLFSHFIEFMAQKHPKFLAQNDGKWSYMCF